MISDYIEKSIMENKDVFSQVLLKKHTIEKILFEILDVIKRGNKIMICGNGGSASQSQHFAAEIVGRYSKERKGYPAIALTVDTSILTAVSNDYSFVDVFSRQVEALGNQGDILLSLSTSGTSANVKKAIEVARKKYIKTISLLGKKGTIAELSDIYIDFEGSTPRVQEVHLFILHLICGFLDENL
ncbi:MAG: SIS domain-containing protein [Elusimicrobiales bacterium]|nr:SIS domain-containing protein [Elusimicrobiales bacterium]